MTLILTPVLPRQSFEYCSVIGHQILCTLHHCAENTKRYTSTAEDQMEHGRMCWTVVFAYPVKKYFSGEHSYNWMSERITKYLKCTIMPVFKTGLFLWKQRLRKSVLSLLPCDSHDWQTPFQQYGCSPPLTQLTSGRYTKSSQSQAPAWLSSAHTQTHTLGKYCTVYCFHKSPNVHVCVCVSEWVLLLKQLVILKLINRKSIILIIHPSNRYCLCIQHLTHLIPLCQRALLKTHHKYSQKIQSVY